MKLTKWKLLKLLIVAGAVVAAAGLTIASPFVLPDNLPEGMSTYAPQRCLALFLVCVSLWFTNLIHPAATGLLAVAMLPMLGIYNADRAFALFGNSAVFFMLGVFLLAAATISTGLSKRITLLALQRFDSSPFRLIAGVLVSCAFLSLWMPEHAVAAMMFPIVLEMTESLRLKKGHPYAKELFFALAWGSIIGGVGTFLGGARAPLALSLLRQSHPDTTISFLYWMAAAMPVVLLMLVVALGLLRRRLGTDEIDIKATTSMLDARVKRLGPMSGAERRLAVLGLLTIASWIILGHKVDLAVIAVISAVLLFVLRIVEWKATQGYVNWGVLVMYGGAVALGKAITDTRAMEWIALELLDPNVPRMVIFLILAGAAILMTEGISNAAAVAVLLPIGYSLGQVAGIDPLVITLVVTIPAGLAFLLPISSPPNAISYSSGHYNIKEMILMSWPMTVAALIVVILVMGLWWPIIGLKVW